uniref:Integrin subunit alpha L n=1 Tax=Spermophilus dauricus TaxID=99837 RepID=A0A8C9PKF4_SPEDA
MKNSCIIVMRLLLSGPFFFAPASSYNLDVQNVQHFSTPHAGRHFGYRVLQLDGHRTRSRGLFPGGKPELTGNTLVTPAKSYTCNNLLTSIQEKDSLCFCLCLFCF